MPSRGLAVLARPLLLGGLGVVLCLAACKEPVPGECLGAPGSLCLTVRNGESFPRGLRAVLDVHVGACEALPPFPCQGGVTPPALAGCKLSCQDVAVPDRFVGADGRFTAEVDLSGSPGPGQAAVRLYDGADREGCAGQVTLPFDSGAAAVVLDPKAAACPPKKMRCTSHADCGGDLAQVCSAGTCTVIDPAQVCPAEMTLIPAGSFVLGNPGTMAGKDAACFEGGQPVRFTLSTPFCLDRTEVTVARFRPCVGGACTAPMGTGCTYQAAGNDDLPVNCVTHAQALAFCNTRSFGGQAGRLPTEAEWERAAGRDPKRRYPWADQVPGDICQYANGSGCEAGALKVRPAGQRPRGNGPSAPTVTWPAQPLVDLAGNLAEWVADAAPIGLHSYCALDRKDPRSQTGPSRIARGGSFADLPPTLYTYARNEYPDVAMTDGELMQRVGVRCALTPALPTP